MGRNKLQPISNQYLRMLFWFSVQQSLAIAMLLLILLRLAMSKNQRRLTRPRFFEVPISFRNMINPPLVQKNNTQLKLSTPLWW